MIYFPRQLLYIREQYLGPVRTYAIPRLATKHANERSVRQKEATNIEISKWSFYRHGLSQMLDIKFWFNCYFVAVVQSDIHKIEPVLIERACRNYIKMIFRKLLKNEAIENELGKEGLLHWVKRGAKDFNQFCLSFTQVIKYPLTNPRYEVHSSRNRCKCSYFTVGCDECRYM